MKKRTSKSKPISASDVVQSLFENGQSPLSDQFTRWRLWRKWEEVVGKTLAPHTEPVGYHKGTLYLWVKSAAWMQQLSFASEPLRDRINAHLGRKWIYRIRFTLDRHAVPKVEEAPEDYKKFFGKESTEK
jgi:predicted nucleic acid-binding Zn ribbon protein